MQLTKTAVSTGPWYFTSSREEGASIVGRGQVEKPVARRQQGLQGSMSLALAHPGVPNRALATAAGTHRGGTP